MNRFAVGVFVLLVTSLGSYYGWVRLRSEVTGNDSPDLVIIEGSPKHFVTPEMVETSRGMVEKVAPTFEAVATDGATYHLDDLCRRGPVVLTFIKDGCPCSEAAQPFWNQLHAAYPKAGFFGVIDRDQEKAARWVSKFRVAYPLLLDPSYRIIRPYQVENSAYVTLVSAEGRILKHWPGYSSAMLRELGETLATLTGTDVQPIDVADAPEQEYTGCPFDL